MRKWRERKTYHVCGRITGRRTAENTYLGDLCMSSVFVIGTGWSVVWVEL